MNKIEEQKRSMHRTILLLLVLVSILLLTPTVLANIGATSNVTIPGGPFQVLVANNSLQRYNFSIVITDVNASFINISVGRNFTLVADSSNRTSDTFWRFRNKTIASLTTLIWNQTTAGGRRGSFNFSIQMRSSTTKRQDNIVVPWTIKVRFSNGSTLTKTVYTAIDSVPPRVHRVNATDGNTTLWNATNGDIVENRGERGFYSCLDSFGDIPTGVGGTTASGLLNPSLRNIINAEVQDQNLRAVNILYRCNSSASSGGDNLTVTRPAGIAFNQTMTRLSSSTIAVHNATINSACTQAAAILGTSDGGVLFILALYDRAGNKYYQNDTRNTNGTARVYEGYEYAVFNGGPNITNVNVTDVYGNILRKGTHLGRSTTGYVRAGSNLTIRVERAGAYNRTLGALSGFVPSFALFKNKPNYTLFFYTVNTSAHNNQLFVGSLLRLHNNTNTKGDGKSLYTNILPATSISTAQGSYLNYVIIANITKVAWNMDVQKGTIVLDGDGPTVTTTLNDITVRPRNTVTYSCTASDLQSGVESCLITLTKPSNDLVTRNSSSCTEQTFTGDDTEALGTYTITCKATDRVGNARTSAEKLFTVTSGGSGSGGGGGGGSGSSTTPRVNVDLTTTRSADIEGKEGIVKTFTLGNENHKIIFKEITSNSVTLSVESIPQVVTLFVGDRKAVDINNDALPDIELILNSITQGFADITINKITASTVVTPPSTPPTLTPEPTPTVPLPEEDVTPPEPINYNKQLITWLITAGIVALIIIGYLLVRRRDL